ncbi:hypothetical protein OPV22_004386 [Ensete ventricosum]|uniref:Uncharacterized protein n=1 Tax=Ensete ventricosum TaxID=4639 RepID=A0AAV8S3M7_ENSVE|nr:hypothetical protein OPV22_004386 [Ensete ventricosum]
MPSTAWARPNKDGPGGYIGRVGDEEPAFCHLLRPSDEATTSPEVEGGRGLNVGRIAWAPHESAEGFGRFALFRGNSGHSPSSSRKKKKKLQVGTICSTIFKLLEVKIQHLCPRLSRQDLGAPRGVGCGGWAP